MPEDLMNISLEEVVFTADWAPEVILPDDRPPFVDSSQDEIVEMEPEKEKPPAASRSRCLRSTAPGRARKKKSTKRRRIRTQDMIKGET